MQSPRAAFCISVPQSMSQARWSPLACGVSRGGERDHIGMVCISFPCGDALTSNWAPRHTSRLTPRPRHSRPPTPTWLCFSTSALCLCVQLLLLVPKLPPGCRPRRQVAWWGQCQHCLCGTAPRMRSRLPTWPCGAPSQTPANLSTCVHPWALSWALPALSLPAGFPPPGPCLPTLSLSGLCVAQSRAQNLLHSPSGVPLSYPWART